MSFPVFVLRAHSTACQNVPSALCPRCSFFPAVQIRAPENQNRNTALESAGSDGGLSVNACDGQLRQGITGFNRSERKGGSQSRSAKEEEKADKNQEGQIYPVLTERLNSHLLTP
jgi:hypothetical protein